MTDRLRQNQNQRGTSCIFRDSNQNTEYYKLTMLSEGKLPQLLPRTSIYSSPRLAQLWSLEIVPIFWFITHSMLRFGKWCMPTIRGNPKGLFKAKKKKTETNLLHRPYYHQQMQQRGQSSCCTSRCTHVVNQTAVPTDAPMWSIKLLYQQMHPRGQSSRCTSRPLLAAILQCPLIKLLQFSSPLDNQAAAGVSLKHGSEALCLTT